MASRGYSRIRKIGEGSFGKAWLVRRGRDGREYIMKTIDIRRMNKKQQKEARNEVKVLSSLKHPYVVCYRDSFFEESNGLCIIMDYAEGGDLSARIRKARDFGQGFPEAQILRWFSQAALALKYPPPPLLPLSYYDGPLIRYMHEKHILHRDLKTQNLFLTRTDRLRLGDFGISKILDSTLAFAETTIGTPYYLSPEICEERPYNWASDIWALGCILYEMCCLKVPFDATNIKTLVDKITKGPTPELPKHYSPELRQLLRDCLNRDWTRRPTAAEIVGRGIVQSEIRRMLEEEEEDDSPRSWQRGCNSRSSRCRPSPVPVPRPNRSPNGPQRYSQMGPRALPRGCPPPPPSPVPKYTDFNEQRSPTAGRQDVRQQPRSPVLDDRRSPVGRVAPDDSPRSVASCHSRDARYGGEGSPRRGMPYCSPPPQQREVVGKRRRVGTSASPAHIPRRQSPRSPVVQGVPVPMAYPEQRHHPRGGQPLVVQGVLVPSGGRGQQRPSQVPDSSPPRKGSQQQHGLPPVWSQPNYRKHPHGISRSVEVENRGPNIGSHRGGGAVMNAGGILASPMKMGGLARRKLQQPPTPNDCDDSPRSCYDVRSSVMSEGSRSPYCHHRRY